MTKSDGPRRRRLRGSAGRVGAEVSALESAHWIGVLERYGLLPNFTLVDDAVTLDATLIWQDEDGRWQHEAVDDTPAPGGPRSPSSPPAPTSTPTVASSRSMRWTSAWTAAPCEAHRVLPRCGHVLTFDTRRAAAHLPRPAGRARSPTPASIATSWTSRAVYSTDEPQPHPKISDTYDDRNRIRFETALSASFDEDKHRPALERCRQRIRA